MKDERLRNAMENIASAMRNGAREHREFAAKSGEGHIENMIIILAESLEGWAMIIEHELKKEANK